MKRARLMLPTFLLAVVIGCGGGDEESSSSDGGAPTAPAPAAPAEGGAGALQVAADETGALKFDKDSLTAKPGKVTITMDNPSPVPHAVVIRGKGVNEAGETVNQGGKSTASAELKAGTYEFLCPVAGHDKAGMKGTLTVK